MRFIVLKEFHFVLVKIQKKTFDNRRIKMLDSSWSVELVGD